jgi:hypothetical protein
MKTFLLLVLTVTALFIWQRNGKPTATETKATREMPAATSSPARPTSDHNWAKHSLDRAHAVADQMRKSREENHPP